MERVESAPGEQAVRSKIAPARMKYGSWQRAMGGMSVYGPSKAALRDLVRVLAAELSPKGIRANAVAPGPIPTPGLARLGLSDEDLKKAKEGFLSMVPLGTLGTVEDIANAIVFLASDAAKYITGTELSVDGGMAQV